MIPIGINDSRLDKWSITPWIALSLIVDAYKRKAVDCGTYYMEFAKSMPNSMSMLMETH